MLFGALLTAFQAEYALNHDETPVGCVFVRNGEIIGRGMNDTNRSLNVRPTSRSTSHIS